MSMCATLRGEIALRTQPHRLSFAKPLNSHNLNNQRDLISFARGSHSLYAPLRIRALQYRSHVASRMVASASSKTVLVPIATGSEEIEAVTIIDTLRRAGAEVTVASVEDDVQVEMSRKVKLVADKLISELQGQQFDLIALPGAERLRDSSILKELLKQQQAADKFLTAICAAPAVVLESQGFLQGKKATSHPGFTDKLSDKSNAESRVVVDGKIVTSRGPGTSLEFALSLVHQLYGKEKADEVAGPMVISQGLEY